MHFRQLGSFKVTKYGAIRQITYDFLFAYACLIPFRRSAVDEKRCGLNKTKIGYHGNVS